MGLVMMFSNQSCNNFDELNTDPNKPAEVSAGLLIANILYRGLFRTYSTFNGTDMGSEWAQHVSKIQYNDEELYNPRETAIQNMWDDFYIRVCLDANRMGAIAAEEGNANIQGIALILEAWGFQQLVDAFGNVPYTQALQGRDGNFTPSYDEEEVVYRGILEKLEQAASLLSADGGDIPSNSDLMFGGDWELWLGLANSLQFRALMRISAKDAETDVDVAARLAEVAGRADHVGTGDAQGSMTFQTNDPRANPVWQTINFDGRKEFRMCQTLVEYLKAVNDPRLEVYAALNGADMYVGKPPGIIGVPNDEWNAETVSELGSLYIGDLDDTPEGHGPESPGYIISASELNFLMAEAVERGFIAGSSTDYYNAGIEASFEEANLDPADAAAYYGQPNVDLDQAINKLQLIGEQKWVALFHSGIEAWTEQRRTGFPELTPAFEGAIDQIPARYTYPNLEGSINPTNYDAASAAIGGNMLTTSVWWMD